MIRLSAMIFASVFLAGCATIFNPDPTSFTATSDPSGATVIVRGVQNGETFSDSTPASFSLDKGSDYQLTFELAGFESEEVIVRRTVNGWFVGSVLLGILPAVVDFATDSMWNHTMNIAHVEFNGSSANGAPQGLARLGITDGEGQTTWVTVPLEFQPL